MNAMGRNYLTLSTGWYILSFRIEIVFVLRYRAALAASPYSAKPTAVN